ncbi:TSUP family transporter [bacterium]|nr:TSUP family transporter [bacterium]
MDEGFLIFAAVGFIAQLVDGALGMAGGVISATSLLSLGVTPAVASASVHASKVFTAAASAGSHIAHRNIDWRMLVILSIAGAIGGAAGTYLLTSFPGDVVRPFVTAYLAFMGGVILWRAFARPSSRAINASLSAPLGVVGGFVDSVGGGGWGPTVTGTLIGAGGAPRQVIGTVNTAEFFVAFVISAAFITALMTGHWHEMSDLGSNLWEVAGLIVGGVAAAPFAGYLTRIVPARPLMIAVGILVSGLALWQTWLFVGPN